MSAKKKEKDKSNLLSEPGTAYKKILAPFNSFEEASEADAKAKAALLPEQHLANVTKRIKEMYADELRKPMDKNIQFKND